MCQLLKQVDTLMFDKQTDGQTDGWNEKKTDNREIIQICQHSYAGNTKVLLSRKI